MIGREKGRGGGRKKNSRLLPGAICRIATTRLQNPRYSADNSRPEITGGGEEVLFYDFDSFPANMAKERLGGMV